MRVKWERAEHRIDFWGSVITKNPGDGVTPDSPYFDIKPNTLLELASHAKNNFKGPFESFHFLEELMATLFGLNLPFYNHGRSQNFF